MNIFKTFEIFLREPLSILKKQFIQIVNINSSLDAQSSVNVDLAGNKTQVTVVNNEKMYNLFQTVLYKKKVQVARELSKSSRKGQVVLGHLCKRT